ncbi:hypothetical protein DSO57_1033040 [Entomophthora muscae]|uniref:Uncharacterized protein n=1 Tax=Entomophthora muscae TaxID=34485 RepID=A0ACC2REZ6_9FUNG|nr:hypothetical protein DSO57_1033040 [Entomophthora muscae]
MPQQDFPTAVLSQYPLVNHAHTNFPDLFKRLTLLKILRDYEDPKTRHDFRQLTESHSFFMDMGVSVVTISEQFVGAGLFANICRAPASTKPPKDRKPGLLSTLRRSNANPRALFRPGGTYIITPDLTIHYAHEPKSSNDSPKIDLLIKICFNILSSPLPSHGNRIGHPESKVVNYTREKNRYPQMLHFFLTLIHPVYTLQSVLFINIQAHLDHPPCIKIRSYITKIHHYPSGIPALSCFMS